jgi:hypothetical protein
VSKDLPRSAAAAQQVDPAAVLAFVDAVEADPAIELHSLMVVRHGHVVAEGWWAPHTPERTRLAVGEALDLMGTVLPCATRHQNRQMGAASGTGMLAGDSLRGPCPMGDRSWCSCRGAERTRRRTRASKSSTPRLGD